jgi:hypothetical protein
MREPQSLRYTVGGTAAHQREMIGICHGHQPLLAKLVFRDYFYTDSIVT